MYPKKTYKLSIESKGENPLQTKSQVISWLMDFGEQSFVEGEVENIDTEFDYSGGQIDQYEELGGASSALVIYRYDREYLSDIKRRLEFRFDATIACTESSLETKVWLEGWKESFKPIQTKNFLVYPPWETPELNARLTRVEIEPGMAFGTGQHATTQLCLEMIETLNLDPRENERILDVGTGTGILAIAIAKTRKCSLLATDIDTDAVRAAKDNVERNNCDFMVVKDSVPQGEDPFHLVVANILSVVLRKILPDLVQATAVDGKLMMSGILQEEAPEMVALVATQGLRLERELQREGWWVGVFSRSAAT